MLKSQIIVAEKQTMKYIANFFQCGLTTLLIDLKSSFENQLPSSKFNTYFMVRNISKQMATIQKYTANSKKQLIKTTLSFESSQNPWNERSLADHLYRVKITYPQFKIDMKIKIIQNFPIMLLLKFGINMNSRKVRSKKAIEVMNTKSLKFSER